MCLATPTRIISRQGDIAITDRNGLKMEVDVSLLPTAQAGDEIIVHVGIGLAILDASEAELIHAAHQEYQKANGEES